jgi:hypothetical protein
MFMTYWAGLHPKGAQSAVQAGMEFIMKTECRITMAATPRIEDNAPRMITDGEELEGMQEDEPGVEEEPQD